MAAPTFTSEDVRLFAEPLVFSGLLKSAILGPTGMSYPPMYTARITAEVEHVFRGNVKKGEVIELGFSQRSMDPPTFPEGQKCIFTAAFPGPDASQPTLKHGLEATPENLAKAKHLSQLPVGWAASGVGVVCPWAPLGAEAWKPQIWEGPTSPLKCEVTGRPGLLTGPNVIMTAKPVPPEKSIEWTNPDGDGLYTITVTNTSSQPTKCPALLQNAENGEILWAESLCMVCQNKAFRMPESRGVSGKVRVLTLQGNESVSTIVNAIGMDGVEWPKGGYRIEFMFCLGELVSDASFYYMSRHHDAIREKAVKVGPSHEL
eukprot:comp39014_c0_seq1/m.47368 comp39014_c0_seq1/g.47368  ORF comp39014_c0_seq1/g.47368 comp39014_c0_seq1/m.47368 type:complete len:317 (-) comp39014_c0_seq1:50-1000(-)